MLSLSLWSCSQSFFYNQHESTLLIELACWQSVFTVCVNAPFCKLWKCYTSPYWFSPLEDNSFSWVSAVHSDPAVNIDFSVYCFQCVCVCVCMVLPFNFWDALHSRTVRVTSRKILYVNSLVYSYFNKSLLWPYFKEFRVRETFHVLFVSCLSNLVSWVLRWSSENGMTIILMKHMKKYKILLNMQ